jgi:hypothetical protein
MTVGCQTRCARKFSACAGRSNPTALEDSYPLWAGPGGDGPLPIMHTPLPGVEPWKLCDIDVMFAHCTAPSKVGHSTLAGDIRTYM